MATKRVIRKCATCGESFGCDGPAIGPYYCSEECDPESDRYGEQPAGMAPAPDDERD